MDCIFAPVIEVTVLDTVGNPFLTEMNNGKARHVELISTDAPPSAPQNIHVFLQPWLAWSKSLVVQFRRGEGKHMPFSLLKPSPYVLNSTMELKFGIDCWL